MTVSLVVFVSFIYALGVSFWAIYRAMQGTYNPTIARIPTIDAIGQAIGRAAEMGRPIFFTTGTRGSIKDVDGI